MARERSTEQDPETTNDNHSVARRRYLSLVGSVAATGAIAGLSGVATASESESNADSYDEHTLVIAGTGTPSTFEVTVDGHITPLSSDGALSTVGVLGPAAEGAVMKGSRSYRFAGDITSFQTSDAVTVYVDGVRVQDSSF